MGSVMNTTIMITLAAGLIAVLYGILTRAWLMKAPTGNARMNEIAGAIQEGARAYLKKTIYHYRRRWRGCYHSTGRTI